jgi:hypothetical protein
MFSLFKSSSVRRYSVHCCNFTLLIMCIQKRHFIIDGITEQGMRRACHTNIPHSRPCLLLDNKINDADDNMNTLPV